MRLQAKMKFMFIAKTTKLFLDYTNSSFTVYIKIGNQLKNVC